MRSNVEDEVLRNAVHEAMLDIYDAAKKNCNYNATYFLRMVRAQGGLAAARQLLRGDEFPSGLTELWRCGRLDLSLEALVLQPRWADLFSAHELLTARQRLQDLGYLPTP